MPAALGPTEVRNHSWQILQVRQEVRLWRIQWWKRWVLWPSWWVLQCQRVHLRRRAKRSVRTPDLGGRGTIVSICFNELIQGVLFQYVSMNWVHENKIVPKTSFWWRHEKNGWSVLPNLTSIITKSHWYGFRRFRGNRAYGFGTLPQVYDLYSLVVTCNFHSFNQLEVRIWNSKFWRTEKPSWASTPETRSYEGRHSCVWTEISWNAMARRTASHGRGSWLPTFVRTVLWPESRKTQSDSCSVFLPNLHPVQIAALRPWEDLNLKFWIVGMLGWDLSHWNPIIYPVSWLLIVTDSYQLVQDELSIHRMFVWHILSLGPKSWPAGGLPCCA